MARLILAGQHARLELTSDPEDGGTIATCLSTGCDWTETYDTLDDAAEYAADHADRAMHPAGISGALAELDDMAARDRAAGGPPWDVPTHPDHDLPGGWHRGQII